MCKQIIKKNIPSYILLNILNNISTKQNNYYIINKIAFKKGEYLNILENFTNSLKEYYFSSKYFYLDRKCTYNSFLTLIRHICKNNNISYVSKILYDKSSYEIIYYIYI